MQKVSTPKKSTDFKNNYPVKKMVANVPVREINVISMYLPAAIMEKLITLVELTGLSAANIMTISSKPCPCCKDKPVIVKTNNGEFEIPRGIIFYKKTKSGAIITAKKRKS